MAGTSGARISFLLSLLSRFPERKSLCARGVSRELCTDGVTKVRDPLAKGVFPLLVGTERRAPLLLGFSLLLNLPKPCRVLRPAFRILSTTRKNSLSLEICRSSRSEWLFIFTIEKRSEKHQETVHSASKSKRLSDMCPGSERAEPYPFFERYLQSKEHILNLSMKC